MKPVRLFVLVLPLLAACAASPNRPAGAGKERTTTESLDALYQRLDEASRRHAEAASLGEDEARAQREAARLDLQALAARCAALAGCDTARVFGTYDRLLAEHAAREGDGDGLAAADEGDLTLAGEHESPVLSHLPEASRSINLLAGRELRDVIQLNGPVKAALNEWLTWMRPNLVDAFEHYQMLRDRMWPEYEQAGLPEALLFGILAKESGGRVHAVSRAGATGPLQFMYATGLRYGLGQVEGFDTRFDPRLSARANVLYLNDRFAEFNHNLELSLAAYNGGEGRMLRLHQRSGGKPFWHPDVYWQLPPETRDYVPMVLAAAWLFLHPEDYGLEFPRLATGTTPLRLPRAMSINELAICLGNGGTRAGWFRHLRNLNPRYEAHASIAAGTEIDLPSAALSAFEQHCVDGARATLAAEIAASRQPTMMASAASSTYTVRKGDTLNGIVRKMKCRSVAQLAANNRLRGPNYMIRAGQKLKLTGCGRG